MTYLVTGATGFIGSKLVSRLITDGHAVIYLARRRSKALGSQVSFYQWDPEKVAPLDSMPRIDAMIHLAGEPVFQRWTEDVKKSIYDSRICGTRNLVAALGGLRHRPQVLVSASAVGYYGNRGDEVLTENSGPGTDFLAKVCVDWEAEASKARLLGLRVVPIRFATVLGSDGGAFPKMAKPARLGLGATFGNGQQWAPWIHVKDLIDLIVYVTTHATVDEVLNGCAPDSVTNAAFTKALAAAVHRPAFLQAPKFVLRAALGEMSEFLFDSQRVKPEATQRTDFQYRFPQLNEALADLVR